MVEKLQINSKSVISLMLGILAIVIIISLLVYLSNQNKNHSVLEGEVLILKSQKEELDIQVKELLKKQEDPNKNAEINNNSGDSAPSLPYIRPEFLKVEWDKVILETYDEEVIIDSKSIIEEFRSQFRGILEMDNPYPGGYRTGQPSFTFHIISGEEQYTFHSLEHDFFMSDERDSFYRSQEDYSQLAKALLSKPAGYPEENLFSKLYHSGMIVGEKEFNFFLMDSFRIRGIAATFISIEKNEVQPQTLSDDYHEKFTFYYFGEKYDMSLYDEYIHLSSEQPTLNLWYKAKVEDIFNILMVLRAG